MQNDILVELRRFSFPHEARIAGSVLEAEGIDFTLREESLGGAQPELSAVLGGVAILVRASALQAAREALDAQLVDTGSTSEPLDVDDPDAATCAGCGGALEHPRATCNVCDSEPDRVLLTPARARWMLMGAKGFAVLAFLALGLAPVVWDSILKRLGELPERAVVLAAYGVVGVVLAIILARGLSARSDRRL
jgi:hypothetical protein